ncbi:tetratricopeptide repeat protein [Azospirillum sp. Sh1]|uniref:tetratricopeptide repeat protein n=1 Tax=Azospirillum sp. Sh1 TaxID=2607285 RepID=UPI00165DD471|nr:tetratricopeptide repeat protein [Azospirillum sp. Sh1]
MDLTPAAIDRWRQNIANSTRANYLYEMGRALIAEGNKDVGLQKVRAALELYPALHDARSFLIDHLHAEGGAAEAKSLDSQGRTSFPDFPVAYVLFQVKRHLERKEFADARSLLATAGITGNASGDAVYCWQQIMGYQLQAGAPPEDLLESAEAIVALNGAEPKALEVAGMNALLLGRYEDAIRHLDDLCAATQSNHSALLFAGMACHCAGRFADALARFDATLRCTPDALADRLQFHAGAHAHSAASHLAMGDMDAASAAIAQAQAVDPDDFRSRIFLALVLERQERREQAVQTAQNALRVSPDHPFALIVLGHAQALLGQREAALATVARLKDCPSYLASTMLDLGMWMIPTILPLASQAGISLRQATGR